MSRSPLIFLTAILSLFPPLASADHPGPGLQTAAQWTQANPVYPRAVMPARQPAAKGASTNPENAWISSPIPPPSPTSPATFKNGVVVPISGTAAGTGFQNFLVEWAPGLDAASGWETTGVTLVGAGSTPVAAGPLATWDTSSVSTAGYYTIRLTVNISNSPVQALTVIYLEPDLLSAEWPQFLDMGPADGAGIVPAKNSDGSFRLLLEGPAGPTQNNGELWTFPLNGPAQHTTHTGHGGFMQPAVAQFNAGTGDQAMMIDFITSTPVSSNLELFNPDGTFSTLSSNANLWNVGSQLVIEDLAGDSHWQTMGYGIDYNNSVADISAWQPDGTQFNGNFPLQVAFQNSNDGRLNRNPVLVGDIDGDGNKEIVAMEDLSPTTFSLVLFAHDGTPRTWQVGELSGIPVVMAAADLDNNGKLEIILSANTDTQTFLHVFQPDGTERMGWPLTLYNSNSGSQSYLAVGDLNVDGNKEIVYSNESFLYVFKADGSNFSTAWPLQATPVSESFGYNSVAIGDVDGDGFPEIVTVLNTLSSNSDPLFALGSYADQKLLAIRRDGTISKTWQLNAGNGCWLQFWPAPSIGDFNQDGITDIAVASIVGSGTCPTASAGVVTVLSTGSAFNPGLNDWPLVRHDPRNTSVLLCSDFCLSANSPQTVTAGLTASYTLTITPNEIPYTIAINNFTCSGLPKGTSCSFNPSSVTPGLASVSTTLSISTTARTLAMLRPPADTLRFFPATCFGVVGFALIPIVVVPRGRSRRKNKVLFGLLVISSLLSISCGGNGTPQPNPNGTPAGSYTVTVSATGASKIPKTAKLSLIVE